ncbi:MAG: 2-methylcitrate dehydratase, partial [Bryobacterales bacterium]|nr:2-methylcitrate dehydratase [Bryobacterales bacterium]
MFVTALSKESVMNTCERLAAYVTRASWEAISPEARGKLKQHLLDSLGCALGAIQSA